MALATVPAGGCTLLEARSIAPARGSFRSSIDRPVPEGILGWPRLAEGTAQDVEAWSAMRMLSELGTRVSIYIYRCI